MSSCFDTFVGYYTLMSFVLVKLYCISFVRLLLLNFTHNKQKKIKDQRTQLTNKI